MATRLHKRIKALSEEIRDMKLEQNKQNTLIAKAEAIKEKQIMNKVEKLLITEK